MIGISIKSIIRILRNGIANTTFPASFVANQRIGRVVVPTNSVAPASVVANQRTSRLEANTIVPASVVPNSAAWLEEVNDHKWGVIIELLFHIRLGLCSRLGLGSRDTSLGGLMDGWIDRWMDGWMMDG